MDALSVIGAMHSMNSGGAFPKFTAYNVPCGKTDEPATMQHATHSVYILQWLEMRTNTVYCSMIISPGITYAVSYPQVTLVSVDGVASNVASSLTFSISETTVTACVNNTWTGHTVYLSAGLVGVG